MLQRLRGLEFSALTSWPVFWVTLAGNALLPGLLTSQVTGLTFANRLIIMAVTQTVVWTVILGSWLISTRVGLAWWSVVITALVASFMRGLVIGELLPILDISTSSNGFLRVLVSVATVGFLLLASTAAVASSRRYQDECHRLSVTQEELLAARHEAMRLSELDEYQFGEQVSMQLRASIADTFELDRLDAAQHLRAIGDEVVRPLAHSLVRSLPNSAEVYASQNTQAPTKAPTLSAILLTTLHPSYIRPLQIAAACAILPLPSALSRFGVVRGLIVCGVVFLSILLSGLASRALLSPLARPGTLLGVLTLGIVLIFMTVSFALPFTIVTATSVITASLAGLAILTIVTVLLAVGHAFTKRLEQVLMQLAKANYHLTWQIARTNGVRWVRQRAIARALHGPIQSALLSSALRLEKSAHDEVDSEKLAPLIIKWLDSTIADCLTIRDQELLLQEHLTLVTETWNSQCKATFEWDGVTPSQVDQDPVCATILADLIIEGFSNSVRHGRAENIQVCIAHHVKDIILLTIRDDGQERNAILKRGFGTSYRDDVTILHSFTQEEGGGQMVAEIPIAHPCLDAEIHR